MEMDIPRMLLALRAAMASGGQKWLVFDISLAAYWTRARPGLPLSMGIGEEQAETVVATIASFASDLGVPDVVGLTGQRMLSRLVRSVRDRLHHHRQHRRFSMLAQVLDDCSDVLLGDADPG